jgi:hypothetical protein
MIIDDAPYFSILAGIKIPQAIHCALSNAKALLFFKGIFQSLGLFVKGTCEG